MSMEKCPKDMAGAAKPTKPQGASKLQLTRLLQRPAPISPAARAARLAVALPLSAIGLAGVFMAVALPGTYGKSTWSVVGMNALTLLVGVAVALLGVLLCINAVRAPRR